MELLVFGHAGTRVLVFPTRCGRFFDYENFRMLDAVQERIDEGHLQLWCVDSIDQDTFYAEWMAPYDRIRRHQRYEEYLLEEVLPLSEQLNGGSFLMTHGCSLGAYHAVNIALRHPGRFCKAVAFSGRYDLTEDIGDFRDLLSGYRDDLVYFHMPNMYLPNANDPAHLERLRQVELTIVCGDQDPFLGSNQQLVATLADKSIPHQFHVWWGRAHSKRYWGKMAHLYL